MKPIFIRGEGNKYVYPWEDLNKNVSHGSKILRDVYQLENMNA